MKGKKLSLIEVKTKIEEAGYRLLSEYTNVYTHLTLQCPEGHIWFPSWKSFSKGSRCLYCFYDKLRSDFEIIKFRFKEEGYIILNTEFKSMNLPLLVQCPEGHVFKTYVHHFFDRNQKCKICKINQIGSISYFWKGGVSKNHLILYDTFAPQIGWYDPVKRNKQDPTLLETKCAYCGKWFLPKQNAVAMRSDALNRKGNDTSKFYCSDMCKQLCPVYRQKSKYKFQVGDRIREVQAELRQMVFARDNWTCQKCGATKSLECHHVEGIRWEPLQSADMEMCITYCSDCHSAVHKIPGCKYSDMWCTTFDQLNI